MFIDDRKMETAEKEDCQENLFAQTAVMIPSNMARETGRDHEHLKDETSPRQDVTKLQDTRQGKNSEKEVIRRQSSTA